MERIHTGNLQSAPPAADRPASWLFDELGFLELFARRFLVLKSSVRIELPAWNWATSPTGRADRIGPTDLADRWVVGLVDSLRNGGPNS